VGWGEPDITWKNNDPRIGGTQTREFGYVFSEQAKRVINLKTTEAY
jgi:hypothetical protein